MDLIYWSDHSSSRRGEDRIKRFNGGYRYLSSCEHNFTRVYENLVQHPSIHNISIHVSKHALYCFVINNLHVHIEIIKQAFVEKYSDAVTELSYRNDYELLIAIILSRESYFIIC